MPRKLRVEYGGASYHVLNRGNYRQLIFEEDDRKDAFRRTLAEAVERYGWALHAYVIMGNHFHLCLTTPEPNLSLGMKWLQGTWTMRVNRFRGQQGRPFQGRYKGILVEQERVARVCSYIHLNPYRAGLEKIATLGTYPWCSLEAIKAKREPSWMSFSPLINAYGSIKTIRGLSRHHLADLENRITHDPGFTHFQAEAFEKCWCIGSKEFKKEQLEIIKAKAVSLEEIAWLGLTREEDEEIRKEQWAETLAVFAGKSKINLKNLPPKKSAPEKAALAYLMKKSTSATNAWLAEHLDMGQAGSVTQVVKRFERNLTHRSREKWSKLSKVKT